MGRSSREKVGGRSSRKPDYERNETPKKEPTASKKEWIRAGHSFPEQRACQRCERSEEGRKDSIREGDQKGSGK